MGNRLALHQYVPLTGLGSANESLIADRVIQFLYATSREQPSVLQSLAASRLASSLLATWEFDFPLMRPLLRIAATAHRLGIDLDEVHGDLRQWRSLRCLFERQIRYWQLRPMANPLTAIMSPADGKALAFGDAEDSLLPIKSRWISPAQLIGSDAIAKALSPLCGVIVRLTPDAYHYVHAPVSGVVQSHQMIEGALHSCNPTALLSFDQPYVMNLRRVTVIDTDVDQGSHVGRVVLVNVAAMMIGRIEDAYSHRHYDAPSPISAGMFVRAGQPFALFRPGSSTSIVLWQPRRAALTTALVNNASRTDVNSRFSHWLKAPWVETAIHARATLASFR